MHGFRETDRFDPDAAFLAIGAQAITGGLNNDGVIVGSYVPTMEYHSRAFIATPIPVLASIWFLAPGVGLRMLP